MEALKTLGESNERVKELLFIEKLRKQDFPHDIWDVFQSIIRTAKDKGEQPPEEFNALSKSFQKYKKSEKKI